MAKKDVILNKKAELLLDRVFDLDGFVKVGILTQPDRGRTKSLDFKTKQTEFGIEKTQQLVVDIARVHEFGTDRIPQRSFLRSTYEENFDKVNTALFRLAKREVKKNDTPDPKRVLALLGNWFVGRVRRKFTDPDNEWPPLRDKTRGKVNKEGRATPLVDTGQLRRSINYEVVIGKSEEESEVL